MCCWAGFRICWSFSQIKITTVFISCECSLPSGELEIWARLRLQINHHILSLSLSLLYSPVASSMCHERCLYSFQQPPTFYIERISFYCPVLSLLHILAWPHKGPMWLGGIFLIVFLFSQLLAQCPWQMPTGKNWWIDMFPLYIWGT